MPQFPAIGTVPQPTLPVGTTVTERAIQLTPGRATRIRLTAYRASGCDGAALIAVVPRSQLQAARQNLAAYGQPLWPRAALEESLLFTLQEPVWYVLAQTASGADPLTLYIQQWIEALPGDMVGITQEAR